MRIHRLEDSFDEEKQQEIEEQEGGWEDQNGWEDRFENNQDDNQEKRLAKFYGTGSTTSNVRGNSDSKKLRVVEDSCEDMPESGAYYGEEGVIDLGVIQGNYIDEIKVEQKPKSTEIFEVEQEKPNSKSDSRNQVQNTRIRRMHPQSPLPRLES